MLAWLTLISEGYNVPAWLILVSEGYNVLAWSVLNAQRDARASELILNLSFHKFKTKIAVIT